MSYFAITNNSDSVLWSVEADSEIDAIGKYYVHVGVLKPNEVENYERINATFLCDTSSLYVLEITEEAFYRLKTFILPTDDYKAIEIVNEATCTVENEYDEELEAF